MILWLGLGAGLVTGLGWSRLRGHPYRYPAFNHIWLIFVGFLPQFFVIYLGGTRVTIPDWMAATVIVTSQLTLLVFAWLNRHLAGMLILSIGLILNTVAMIANGGFMPINPDTAERIVGKERISTFELGSRIGYKDILLHQNETRLEVLADRFLPPARFSYQVAFSLGDVFIALGAFWILANQNSII
jgi:hypothetical protein